MGQTEALAQNLIKHYVSSAGASMICSAIWMAFEAETLRLSATTHSAHASPDGKHCTRPMRMVSVPTTPTGDGPPLVASIENRTFRLRCAASSSTAGDLNNRTKIENAYE